MRLAVYLWGDTGEPPLELIKYQLRTLYGVTPYELRKNKGRDLIEMMRDLHVRGFIENVRRAKAKGNG